MLNLVLNRHTAFSVLLRENELTEAQMRLHIQPSAGLEEYNIFLVGVPAVYLATSPH